MCFVMNLTILYTIGEEINFSDKFLKIYLKNLENFSASSLGMCFATCLLHFITCLLYFITCLLYFITCLLYFITCSLYFITRIEINFVAILVVWFQ
jgi:hypothetical protein